MKILKSVPKFLKQINFVGRAPSSPLVRSETKLVKNISLSRDAMIVSIRQGLTQSIKIKFKNTFTMI